MFVKPAEGLTVRRPHPSKQFLPAHGAEVDLAEGGFYWARRLRDGDIVETEKPPEVSAGATPAAHVAAEEPSAVDEAKAALTADAEKLAVAEAAATEPKGDAK